MRGTRDVRWPLALVALAACGRTGFDPVDGGPPSTGPEQLALPAGGEAWSVATTPADPAVVYAVVAGRVFRSDDRAATWIDCGSSADAVLPDRADRNVVYAAGERGVYRSTDRCATWTMLSPEAAWTLASAGDDIVLGGVGLHRLHGDTVSPMPSPFDDEYIEDVAVAGTTILAASASLGLVRSTNDGASFAIANTGIADPRSGGVTFPDPADPTRALAQMYSGAYYSTDGGESWTPAQNGIDGQGAIVADPGDPTFVLATTWNGILASTDGGITYDTANKRTTNMGSAWVNDYAFDASGSGRVYAATFRGVFAADHALGWGRTSEGLDAWSIYGLARAPDQQVVYANTSAGVLRSDDDGATWALSSDGMEGATSSTSYTHIAVFAADQLLVAGGSWLWRSLDGGHSFAEAAYAGAGDVYTITSVASALPATVVYGTKTKIYVSVDGGDTFSARTVGGGDRVNDVVIDPATGQWFATDGGVYAAFGTDPFAPIEAVGALGEAYTLARAIDGRMLVGTDNGVQVRAGTAWTPVGLAGIAINDLVVDGDRWIAASPDHGVFVTDDGGATWRDVPEVADRRPFRLVLDSTGRLIVGTLGYGMLRVAL